MLGCGDCHAAQMGAVFDKMAHAMKGYEGSCKCEVNVVRGQAANTHYAATRRAREELGMGETVLQCVHASVCMTLWRGAGLNLECARGRLDLVRGVSSRPGTFRFSLSNTYRDSEATLKDPTRPP